MAGCKAAAFTILHSYICRDSSRLNVLIFYCFSATKLFLCLHVKLVVHVSGVCFNLTSRAATNTNEQVTCAALYTLALWSLGARR